MKIYAISGLGADKRVFQELTLSHTIVSLDWISPRSNEPIADYALRLAGEINTDEPYAIMGVSFGGLIATEISKKLQPKVTFLISSAEVRSELKPMFRFMGKLNFIRFISPKKLAVPKPIAHYFFETKNTELLDEILDDSDLVFSKWAIQQLIKWQNVDRIPNCIKISGTNDRMMPSADDAKTIKILDGAHFMIVDKSNEISEIINEEMARF